jgi:hypothetical protein
MSRRKPANVVVAARAGNHTPVVNVISKVVAKKPAAVTGVKEAGSQVAVRLVDKEAESTHEHSSQTGRKQESWTKAGRYS